MGWADADRVEVAGVAEGDRAGGVDAVAADAEVSDSPGPGVASGRLRWAVAGLVRREWARWGRWWLWRLLDVSSWVWSSAESAAAGCWASHCFVVAWKRSTLPQVGEVVGS